MINFQCKDFYTVDDLVNIVHILRPAGVPGIWSRPMRRSAVIFWKKPTKRWRPLTRRIGDSVRSWATC